MKKIINNLAKEYAISCHEGTNHLYDGKPYSVHLDMVVEVVKQFIHLIPEKYHNIVIDAAWCHDVIEDCRQTYNDVRKVTNTMVADIVYAVTNEKGRTRAERANDKYYDGIRNCEFATFVKVCDRIANFQYSIKSGSNMAQKYRRENIEFIDKLYHSKYEEMFNLLKSL